jgi:arylamine N-acetyltransferase
MINSWQQSYLNYLGIAESSPDLNYLTLLTSTHLRRVPYETVSKFHFYMTELEHGWLVPPIEEFVSNLTRKGWGGNCYTITFNFGRLLTSLGYDVSYVRVNPGHVALMVTIDKISYYTDVGYGAPLFTPLRLKEEIYLHQCGEEITIIKQSDEVYEIDRKRDGHSFVTKQIEWMPLQISDFYGDILFSHRDHDDNPFMRRITISRFNEGYLHYLRNEKLIVQSNEEKVENTFTDQEEWLGKITETFGIEREVLKNAINFLIERDVVFLK